MIRIRQTILPRSRTPESGSKWEASAEIDGRSYSAVSRQGAPQALARALVAAGIPDQPVELCSEVCVLDNGAEIRTEQRRDCIRYRSLHRMAGWTFTEGARTPLHMTRYREQPEGLFLVCGEGENAFHRPPDDILVIPEPDPLKMGRRRCVSCDRDFLPARPWSRFCSPACRLRAHRLLVGRREAKDPPQFRNGAP